MSSTQSERGFWTGIKCSGCRNDVENPVQLPACLHIVCLNCLHNLESNSAHNICCPKCGDENARPGVLQIISGVEKSSRENMLCDLEPEHGIAKWNCFECGLNMCGSCRVNHVKDHNIKLLGHLQVLSNTIWEQKDNKDSKTAITSNTVGQVNRSTLSFTHCPICNESNCQHVQLLQNLTDRPLNSVIHCQQDGHIDVELKYFCHECWIPVCGDCSQKGKHKLHKCDDISSCGKEYLVKSLATLKEELHILVETSKQDVAGIKTVEEQLRQHVEDTDRELNSRKLKILEETEHAFDMAITNSVLQGRNILMDYRNQLDVFQKFQLFLLNVEEAFASFTIDDETPSVMQNIRAFYHQKFASKLISQLHKEYTKLTRPAERRLVLHEVEVDTIPPPSLARIGAEWKQLKLAFSFKLDDDFSVVKSIILTDSNTCLLSIKKFAGRSQYDSIVQYHYNSSRNCAELNVYDTDPGDYFITQLQSGEIVASYTSPASDSRDENYHRNSVRYISKLPVHNSYVMHFNVIKEFDFPPYSIATTKDNNILLCVNADKKKGLSYLMLINLLGNELKSTVKQQGANMICPNYVAVSDNGEICVSDTAGSNIVILDKDLDSKERMNYQLPTSVNETGAYEFEPHGVCYDSYGRIIVADPKNSCVLRLLRAEGTSKYKLEPLLVESSGLPGFRNPILVAMGKDSRLWVVCCEHVFVFDYCS